VGYGGGERMKIPQLWQLVKISDVCNINPVSDKISKLKNDDLVTFVPMAAVDEHYGEITKPEIKRYKEVPKGFTPFQNGDVLFAKITPSMENGKAAIAKNLKNGVGFGSTEFHVLRPCDQLLPDYLFYFIRQKHFRKWAKYSFVGSAGQQRVPKVFFERVPFPLPPLPEQERIVNILWQADNLKRLRDETLSLTQDLFQNLFLEMFGDPINNPNDFKKVRMDKLGVLDRGISKHRPRDAAFLYGGPYPFIQTSEVTNSGGWITNYSQTYSEKGLAQSKLWPRGTLCITIAANIAKTGILTFDACFPDSIVGFMPKQDVTTEYVMFALGLYQKKLESQAPQAAQKNINLQTLRSLKIPKPLLNLQKQFSLMVKQIYQHISNIKTFAEDLENLNQQIHAAAFCGDLTFLWRNKNRTALRLAVNEREFILNALKIKLTIKEEDIPKERPWLSQLNRHWLKDQLSDLQGSVFEALREWKGTLIPSEDLDAFRESAFPIVHLENASDLILRALHQLAELGLIAKISVDNREGDYVTAFRGLREEEFSQVDDRQYLAKG
jgi:type I restriction enzyme, S subunit